MLCPLNDEMSAVAVGARSNSAPPATLIWPVLWNVPPCTVSVPPLTAMLPALTIASLLPALSMLPDPAESSSVADAPNVSVAPLAASSTICAPAPVPPRLTVALSVSLPNMASAVPPALMSNTPLITERPPTTLIVAPACTARLPCQTMLSSVPPEFTATEPLPPTRTLAPSSVAPEATVTLPADVEQLGLAGEIEREECPATRRRFARTMRRS